MFKLLGLMFAKPHITEVTQVISTSNECVVIEITPQDAGEAQRKFS